MDGKIHNSNRGSGFNSSFSKLKSQNRGRKWSGVEQNPVGFKSGSIMSGHVNEGTVVTISSDEDSNDKCNAMTQTVSDDKTNATKKVHIRRNIPNSHFPKQEKVTKVILTDGTERLLSMYPHIVGTPLPKQQQTTQTVVINGTGNGKTDYDPKNVSDLLSLQNSASALNYSPQDLNTIWENALNEAQKTYSSSKIPPLTIDINVGNDSNMSSNSLSSPLNNSVEPSSSQTNLGCIKPKPAINNNIMAASSNVNYRQNVKFPMKTLVCSNETVQKYVDSSKLPPLIPIRNNPVTLVSSSNSVSFHKQLHFSSFLQATLEGNDLQKCGDQNNILSFQQNSVIPVQPKSCLTNDVLLSLAVSTANSAGCNNTVNIQHAPVISAQNSLSGKITLNPSVKQSIISPQQSSLIPNLTRLENNINNVSNRENTQNSLGGSKIIDSGISKFLKSSTLSNESILLSSSNQIIGICVNLSEKEQIDVIDGPSTSKNVEVDSRSIMHVDHPVSSSLLMSDLNKNVPPSSESFDGNTPVKRKSVNSSNCSLAKKAKIADNCLRNSHEVQNLEKSTLNSDLLLPKEISSKFVYSNNCSSVNTNFNTDKLENEKENTFYDEVVNTMLTSLFKNPRSSASKVLDSPFTPNSDEMIKPDKLSASSSLITSSSSSKDSAMTCKSDNANEKSSISTEMTAKALTDLAVNNNVLCKHCESHNFDDESIMDHSKEFICKHCDFVSTCKFFMAKHILSRHTNAIKTTSLKNCEICNCPLHAKNFIRHMSEFKCYQCPFVINCESVFAKHISTNHLSEYPHKRKKCPFSTSGCQFRTSCDDTFIEHVTDHACSNQSFLDVSRSRINSSTCSQTNTNMAVNSFNHNLGDNLILIDDSSDDEFVPRNRKNVSSQKPVEKYNLNILDTKDEEIIGGSSKVKDGMMDDKSNENILISDSSDDDSILLNDISQIESDGDIMIYDSSDEKPNLNNLGDNETNVISLSSDEESTQIIIKNEPTSYSNLRSNNYFFTDTKIVKDELNESTIDVVEPKFTKYDHISQNSFKTDNLEHGFDDCLATSNNFSRIDIKEEPNSFFNNFEILNKHNENIKAASPDLPVIASLSIELNINPTNSDLRSRSDNTCTMGVCDESTVLLKKDNETLHNYGLGNCSDFMDDLKPDPCLNVVKIERESTPEKMRVVGSKSEIEKNLENVEDKYKFVVKEIAEEKPFICQECGFGVATEQNLQLHIKAFHSKKNPKLIPKSCSDPGKKVQAVVVVSTVTHKCALCSFQSSRSPDLKMHLLIEHEILACDICSYETTDSHDLDEHYGVHKKIPCSFCRQRFSSIQKYYTHVISKHGINFKCGHCFCCFIHKKQLLEHYYSVHDGDKKLKCGVCQEKFFDCPDCDFQTRLRCALDHHQLKQHPFMTQRKSLQSNETELCSEVINIKGGKVEGYTISRCDDVKNIPDKSIHSEGSPAESNSISQPKIKEVDSNYFKCSKKSVEIVSDKIEIPSMETQRDLTTFMKPNDEKQTSDKLSASDSISSNPTPKYSGLVIKSDVANDNYPEKSGPTVNTQSKNKECDSEECHLSPSKEDTLQQKYRCRFNCSHCGYRASNELSFKEHLLDKHSSGKLLSCYHCKFFTKDNNELTKHKYECHPERYPFSCTQCSTRFSRKDQFAKHVSQMHNITFENQLIKVVKSEQSSEITCKYCGFKSDNSSIMDKHKLLNHKDINENICEICTHSSKNFKDLHKHYIDSHPDFIYKCGYCSFVALKKREVSKHKYKTHSESLPFSCKHCIYRTNKSSHLVKHETFVHGKPRSKYTLHECSFCLYKTSEIKELIQHKYIKHWAKYRFKCGTCTYRGKTKESLKSHCKSVHKKIINTNSLQPRVVLERLPAQILRELQVRDNPKNILWKVRYPDLVINVDKESKNDAEYFYCKECNNFKTKTNYEYERHLVRNHIAQCFYCEYCTSVFNSYDQYYSHMYDVHSREKIYKCQLCNYISNLPISDKHIRLHKTKCHYCKFEGLNQSVKEHINKCHSEKYPLFCDKCGYQTKDINYLYYHKRKMHDMFLCKFCDCSCEFKHQINHHIELFHPEKMPFSCKECNMKFPTTELLLNHTMRYHKNKCPHCNFKGQSTLELIDHKYNSHFSDYELGCVVCSYRGPKKSNMILHEIRYHFGRTYRCKWCKFFSNSFDKLSSHITIWHKDENP